MFRGFLKTVLNSNNKRQRGDSFGEGSSVATTASTIVNNINKRMMMDDQQMEIDQVDPMTPIPLPGPSHSNVLDLVPNIDETNTCFGDLSPVERFVKILDQLDSRVENLRKEALTLQGQAEFLHMSIDLLKNHDHMNFLEDTEREEIDCYVKRVSGRLQTIELRVLTVRDTSQEESLYQVNRLIDELLLASRDPVICRQKCQEYLNACSTSEPVLESHEPPFVDKRFESALLGCSLDDQKRIKQRLNSLLLYLSKKSVSD